MERALENLGQAQAAEKKAKNELVDAEARRRAAIRLAELANHEFKEGVKTYKRIKTTEDFLGNLAQKKVYDILTDQAVQQHRQAQADIVKAEAACDAAQGAVNRAMEAVELAGTTKAPAGDYGARLWVDNSLKVVLPSMLQQISWVPDSRIEGEEWKQPKGLADRLLR